MHALFRMSIMQVGSGSCVAEDFAREGGAGGVWKVLGRLRITICRVKGYLTD